MPWETEVIGGVETIVGHIGDPLELHVEATVSEYLNLDGVVWLCQIRRRGVNGPLLATLDLAADGDQSTATEPVGDDPGSTSIDLTFDMPNTSGFVDSKRYFFGVKAIDGDFAPLTIVASHPIIGYDVVPRQE